MGILKSTGKVAGHIVDVRVDRWISFNNLHGFTTSLFHHLKSLFQVEKSANPAETFEDAVTRLEIDEPTLALRKKHYGLLSLFFFAIALVIFGYSVYIASAYGNYSGFFMGLSATIYSLTQAFRHHFWHFQIHQRKLNCSFKEWLNFTQGTSQE
jgi:intracellular multiplication protein IcmV